MMNDLKNPGLLWWVIPGSLAGMPMPFIDPQRRMDNGGALDAYDDELRPVSDRRFALRRVKRYCSGMVLATSNKHQRLLCLNYIQRVSSSELEKIRDEVKSLLAELPVGFRLLVDLSQVEFMDPECAPEIGRTMDLIDQSGVGVIVRIIPDSAKDIGLNILTVFHYPHHPRVITCKNLAQALQQLALWDGKK